MPNQRDASSHLKDLHLPSPPIGPEPLGVGAAVVADHVLLHDVHEHALARQRVHGHRVTTLLAMAGLLSSEGTVPSPRY
jgi:hypothetical protein